ncbi:MAG TPA: FAD-binding oxidoreductase [Solirubrobacteraceae bacterium]
MTNRAHKHWGWGFADQQPGPLELRAAASGVAAHLGFGALEVEDPLLLADVRLAPVRLPIPAALAEFCAADVHARASHALGKSYPEVVLGFRGHFDHPPDFVAYPRSDAEIERVLEWCSAERVAVIPFGGGTSVVGGVRPEVPSYCNGAISLDLRRLDRLLELDPVSRSARIQAGACGPRLEEQLAEHGFTLRHFPQSFEYATLGGWLATRAAGHFATLWTHIEDMTESVRALTPLGVWESRRLPGSGAGISPDRMLCGSEGTLGVIADAWLRVLPRPLHKRSAAVAFDCFSTGVDCVRALSQSGLHPANCRLIDPREARLTMAGDGSRALLLLGFESADHPVDHYMDRALELCRAHGGEVSERSKRRREGGVGAGGDGAGGDGAGGDGADAVGSWRQAFLGAPYMRDLFVATGVLSETFETAITWERFSAFHERVTAAAEEALREVCQGGSAGVGGRGPAAGQVSCRFTHVYPDGPAAYFTVIAPASRGEEVEQWWAIKRAVSDAIIDAGGTITHHHAVGRDHRPWYDRQRPEPFAAALRGAKAAVDPHGIMNPGVLIDPLPGPLDPPPGPLLDPLSDPPPSPLLDPPGSLGSPA